MAIQFKTNIIIPNEDYNAVNWNGNNEVPTKNSMQNIIEQIIIDSQNFLQSEDIDTLSELNAILTDATLITDAPSDGNNYVRNNGVWIQINDTSDGLGPDGAAGDLLISGNGTIATLNNGVVTNTKLGDGSVSTGKIQTQAITANLISTTNGGSVIEGDVLTYDASSGGFTFEDPSTLGGGLTLDQTNRLLNANLSAVTEALIADVNLSTLTSNVTSGSDIGRKIVYSEATTNTRRITVNDSGSIDDVWRFRTDSSTSAIELVEDTGVTINFIGNQNNDGVKIEGFDQYCILRKTASNTYTASGNIVGFNATANATIPVSESLADGEETISTGAVANGSSAINLNNTQICGLIFQGLSIPAGATIETAVISFEAAASDSDAISQIIEVESSDALLFNTSTNNISSRTTTASSVAWNNIEAWTNDLTYDSPDISTIVQEWIDRVGYVSDDNLCIIFSPSSGTGERAFTSWNGTGLPASISIDYRS